MPPARASTAPGADLPQDTAETSPPLAADTDQPAAPTGVPTSAVNLATQGGRGAAGAGVDGLLTGRSGRSEAFVVELENFSGPFDLLLSLIAKHKLDVTEVALSQVTDEFVAHLRRLGERFDLGQATEFLVIAATLLDLMAARLLQYRAYKEVAAIFAALIALESRHAPRAVPLEARYVAALPEVQITIGPSELAAMAARLREPVLPPIVATDHVHAPKVSVREHMLVVIQRLRELGAATFQALCVGCQETIEVVARFLALLELFREGRITFEQPEPLGELLVRWCEEQPGGALVGGGLDPLTQFPARAERTGELDDAGEFDDLRERDDTGESEAMSESDDFDEEAR